MKNNEIKKIIRFNNMTDLNRSIKINRDNGYELVGKVMETLDGKYHALMIKKVEWKDEKNENSST